MNWLMTFAEKNGSPTLYGKTDNPTSRDDLLYAFEDISDGTTGLVVGAEDEVGVLESSHKGETFFDTLAYKDNQIFRRMFIGNLLLGDNSQTGTYAQSQTQLEFGNMVFDGILEEIANTIQEQIINPIVEFNFGPNIKAPVISFDKFSSGDMQKLFTIIKPLMDSGVVDSENSAVQEALALLFKAEAGVDYNNEEPALPFEDFNIAPVNGETLTSDILSDLDGI
jgi:phage gp29-like protein